MTKANLTKLIGTAAALVAGGGAAFLPQPYGHLAVDLALVILAWLHLPQPGTVKAEP